MALHPSLNNLLTIRGRRDRLNYWQAQALVVLPFAILSAISDLLVGNSTLHMRVMMGRALSAPQMILGSLLLITFILTLLISLSIFIQRLHDTGKSGWTALFLLIPTLNIIWIFAVGTQKGKPGPNVYGPDPEPKKGKPVFEEFFSLMGGRRDPLSYNLAFFACYWIGFFVVLLGLIVLGSSDLLLSPVGFAAVGLLVLVSVLITLSIAAQRLRDMGYSGWLAILMLVPMVSFVMFYWLILTPGTAGDNRYGPSPLKG